MHTQCLGGTEDFSPALTFFRTEALKAPICDFTETFLMNGAASKVEHAYSVENVSNTGHGEEQDNSEK